MIEKAHAAIEADKKAAIAELQVRWPICPSPWPPA